MEADKELGAGLGVLGAGLLCTGLSGVLDRTTVLGTGTLFAAGLLGGLAVVAMGSGLFLLVRGRRARV